MKWLYPTEDTDFATAANWTWVDSSISDDITTGPGKDDTARFSSINPIGEDCVITLNADTTVSNFIYEVDTAPATTVDLGSHTLTISNNFSIKNGLSGISNSRLTFKNGAIEVPGSAKGTDYYGQPGDDYSGFFANRMQDMTAGFNIVFDNASLIVTNAVKESILQAKALGDKTSYICLTNGASWTLSSLKVASSGDEKTPVEMTMSGENTSLKVLKTFTLGTSGHIALTVQGGASLDVLGISTTWSQNASSNILITLNGGQHKFGDAQNSGDNGSFTLSKTEVVATNKAEIVANGKISFRSSSLFKVCDGAKVTTSESVAVGHQAHGDNSLWGTSTLEIDGGTISANSFTFGQMAKYSNNWLRVVGPLSYMESQNAVYFNYGTKVAFEIPEGGYCDENGAARVPVVSKNNAFTMTTDESCDPLSLKLTTKAFDKKHPKTSITLIKAEKSSTDALKTLAENVTFVDSAKNPGTVTVSDDDKSLIYTAPAPMGFVISVK